MKSDEWCLTYCSQSVAGRINSKEPDCRSICIRKVFPHEVKNILSFKKHENVGPDLKAKYPLPMEGQPINLPRLLGGTSNSDSEDHPKPSVTKFWDEGWYLWTGQNRWAFLQQTNMMMLDFQKQEEAELKNMRRKEVWDEYQEQLKREVPDQQSPSWGLIVPLRPMRDTRYVPDLLRNRLHFDSFRSISSDSLLVPLPPEFPPIFEKIHKFLQPTYRVLNIMHESVASGEQKQFALRVWEKVKTGENLVFAQRILAYSYEQWKQWPREDDNKKDSTTKS
jgi:hypothetical protein